MIGWLRQQNVELPLELIPKKIADHRRTTAQFLDLLTERKRQLLDDVGLHRDFVREMTRFLPPRVMADTIEQRAFWAWLTDLIAEECMRVERLFTGDSKPAPFRM